MCLANVCRSWQVDGTEKAPNAAKQSGAAEASPCSAAQPLLTDATPLEHGPTHDGVFADQSGSQKAMHVSPLHPAYGAGISGTQQSPTRSSKTTRANAEVNGRTSTGGDAWGTGSATYPDRLTMS
jgi:hypothetical protein